MIKRIIKLFLDIINNALLIKPLSGIFVRFFEIVILFISKKNKRKEVKMALFRFSYNKLMHSDWKISFLSFFFNCFIINVTIISIFNIYSY